MLVEHLAGYFVDFGETVTIDGADVTAIFDGGYAETLNAAGTAPSLFCQTAEVSAVQIGDTVVRGATNYVIRIIVPEPPDEIHTRLVLETA